MSKIDAAARWVGNLDHPHYADERQRHVWYEASTIALQGLATSMLAVAAASVWLGGTTAIPYTVAFLTVMFVNMGLFQVYVIRHRTAYVPRNADFRSPRVLISLGLGLAYFAGVARAIEIGIWPVIGFAATMVAVAAITSMRSK